MPCAPRVSEKKSPAFSAFTSANVSRILALELDLVLTFSDLQAEIVATLIREGVQVHAFNQRTVAGILDMVRMVGGIVGKQEAAEQLAQQLAASFEKAKAEARNRPRRPRVYFEEWDGPMISGIGWVSEIVEAAGGIDVFANLAREKSAKNRICQHSASH
jgi:iron complex transport system substrate-binding protein